MKEILVFSNGEDKTDEETLGLVLKEDNRIVEAWFLERAMSVRISATSATHPSDEKLMEVWKDLLEMIREAGDYQSFLPEELQLIKLDLN